MGEQWTIEGRVVVDHLLPELQAIHGARSGLAGVTLQVWSRAKAADGWGHWTSWGTVATGRDGQFALGAARGSGPRQFRVGLLFDSVVLRLGDGPDVWHEVHNDTNRGHERRAGRHDLGDLQAADGTARRHGDIWVLYRQAIDVMASFGAAFAFKGQVALAHPPGPCSTATLLHRLMHRWEDDHCASKTRPACETAGRGDTCPDRGTTTHLPFLEAFADWAAVRLLQELSGGRLKNFLEAAPCERPDHPFSRDYVGRALPRDERRLANLDSTERGWYALFTLLTFPCLDRIDVDQPFTDIDGEDDRYAFLSLFADLSDFRLGYSFREVLDLFLPHPARQLPHPLATAEMTYRAFLDRATRILPGFDAGTVRQLKLLLNPAPAEIRSSVALA